MADFIHETTYEIRKSVSEPELDNKPGWHRLRDKQGVHYTLPKIPSIYWKGFPPVEMTASEKLAKDASIKPVKRKEQVMHEIYLAIPGEEFLAFLDACDKHPSFVFALEMGAINVARGILEKAKFRSSISESHYNKIKIILE